MKPARLHSLAREEIRDSVAFYNDARGGLGDEFADAVEDAVGRIERQPRAGSPHHGGYRKRVVSNRFPHVIFYVEYDDYVWVASVYHASREPDAWMTRTPETDGTDEPTA